MKDDSSKKGSTGVVGVIGAASSVVSIQVASLLRLFSIPQVSYTNQSSTSVQITEILSKSASLHSLLY